MAAITQLSLTATPGRRYLFLAKKRAEVIAPVGRTITVAAETRVIDIAEEIRVLKIVEENRIITVQ